MITKQLHCFAGKRWSGDATSALNSALKAGGIVVTEGDEDLERRLNRAGISDVRRLNMSGLFGALRLSRLLRLTNPDEVVIYSSALIPKMRQAISLAKMPQVEIKDLSDKIFLPEVKPVKQGNSLIWIGYITKHCGLRTLLEVLKEIPEVGLKVVGEGEAKIVSPLLKLSKTPELRGRIDWRGEQEDVYSEMNGCLAGIVTSENPQGKLVYHEFKNAGVPVITATDAHQLKQQIISLL